MNTIADELPDEPLLDLPALPSPAKVNVNRPVDDNATVAIRGNRHSVPPGLSGHTIELRHRLASPTLDIHAASGTLLATDGTCRDPHLNHEHRAMLQDKILGFI